MLESIKRIGLSDKYNFMNPHYVMHPPLEDGQYTVVVLKGTNINIADSNDTLTVIFHDQRLSEVEQKEIAIGVTDALENVGVLCDPTLAPEALVNVQIAGVNGTIADSKVVFQYHEHEYNRQLLTKILESERCRFK